MFDNENQTQELRSNLKKYSQQAGKIQEVLQCLVKEAEALKEHKNQIQILTLQVYELRQKVETCFEIKTGAIQ